MTFEVEMKFAAPPGFSVDLIPADLKAEFLGEKRQRDLYFNHPARDFAQTDEAFRMRDEDGELFLTYKGPKIDALTKTREEIETFLGSAGTTWEPLALVWQRLGFRPVALVSKVRQVYRIVSEGEPVTFSVDQVDKVGTFLEIEAIASNEDKDLIRDRLLRLAERLGWQNPERRSYLELLLERMGK